MSPEPGRRLLMIEQGGRGGVADYTGELVAALAGEGWNVTLATAADNLYRVPSSVTVRGVFHYIRGERPLARRARARGLGPLINGLRFLAAMPRLMRLARRADIVHSQGWEAPEIGLLAVLLLRATGTPIVQTAHGTFEREAEGGKLRRPRLLMAHLTAATIVHTEADHVRLGPELREKVTVIPHGEYGALARQGGELDRDQARTALGLAPDVSATLMFGQLRPDKGLGDLIEAVEQVPGLHLLVGGHDTGGLSAVRDRLDALGERALVREGYLQMSEAAQLFLAADTVALPYREASQSGVLLLAYGFSRPVVIYPAGGMVEAVEDGKTGWICAEPTVSALTEALADSVRLGPEECARRGREGRRLADERFAWPGIAQRTGALYERVLAAR